MVNDGQGEQATQPLVTQEKTHIQEFTFSPEEQKFLRSHMQQNSPLNQILEEAQINDSIRLQTKEFIKASQDKVTTGSNAAQEIIYLCYQPLIFSKLNELIPYDDKEDLVQDVFIGWLKAETEGVKIEDIGAYLVGIVKNKIKIYWRTRISRKTDSLDSLILREENRVETGRFIGASRQLSNIEELALSNVGRDELLGYINQLTPTQRAVFQLVDIEGYTEEDAARLLGIHRVTVASRRHRARASLKRLIGNR